MIGGGIIMEGTATVTPIMVGMRDTINMAATGIPAGEHAISRHKCGRIGKPDIPPLLET